MKRHTVNNLVAFVPAKNFLLSCQFYEALGFHQIVSHGNGVRYEIDQFGFWLQDYYVKEWAENCMLCLYVEDVYGWYEHIKQLQLTETYGELAKIYAPPYEEAGSLMMNVSDPSGVLWHIYQGT